MKKYKVFLVLLLCVIMLCGCSKENTNKADDSTSEEADDEGEAENELSIYTIDYNTLESVPSVSVISPDADVDAKFIVDEVNANFNQNVSIKNIEENADNVVVYFTEGKAPMSGVSKEMETAMLDCIAYSLLDNLEFCSQVFFRSDKGNYVSNNLEIEYDEPYVTK